LAVRLLAECHQFATLLLRDCLATNTGTITTAEQQRQQQALSLCVCLKNHELETC